MMRRGWSHGVETRGICIAILPIPPSVSTEKKLEPSLDVRVNPKP